METAQLNERIEAFKAEMQRLADRGDGRDLLAWTGEQLAAAAEDLRRSAPDDRTAMALYVMYVSRPHISCLYDAGMPLDALATGLMVLMSCLVQRVDPAQFPTGYVAYLQNLFVLATALAGNPQLLAADPDGHLGRIAAMLGTLEVATVEAMPGVLPRTFLETDAAIRAEIDELAPSERTFDGRPVTATMALDIAADSISRLKSLGLEM